jgi:hypothetical protein
MCSSSLLGVISSARSAPGHQLERERVLDPIEHDERALAELLSTGKAGSQLVSERLVVNKAVTTDNIFCGLKVVDFSTFVAAAPRPRADSRQDEDGPGA